MAFGLEGIKVIDLSAVLAGPIACRVLADWGADVVKVESQARVDLPKEVRATMQVRPGANAMALNINRNKRGLALDLARKESRDVIYKLAETADVLVTNFRPRDVEKFGLTYETLSKINPRLIFANLSGYGMKGPERDLPAFDNTAYWCRTGILWVELGEPGMQPITGGGLGDHVAGMSLALGIMTALFVRERTGVGQMVDASLLQAGSFVASMYLGRALTWGQDKPLHREDLLGPQHIIRWFRTKDNRWLCICVTAPDKYWTRICKAIDRMDIEHDERFASIPLIIKNKPVIHEILDEAFVKKTLAEWKRPLDENGIPWSAVQNLFEVIDDVQVKANNFTLPFEHPSLGALKVVGPPVNLSKTTATVRRAPPEIGQHSEEILKEYGFSPDQISKLKEMGLLT